MAHYQLLYPSEFLAACDLGGKEATVEISKFEVEELVGSDGKKQKKPVLTFKGAKKRMVCCKTNAKAIARQHGNDTDAWIGKKVTVYPTSCIAFGSEVECLRIK
jgi:hypothetical protein